MHVIGMEDKKFDATFLLFSELEILLPRFEKMFGLIPDLVCVSEKNFSIVDFSDVLEINKYPIRFVVEKLPKNVITIANKKNMEEKPILTKDDDNA